MTNSNTPDSRPSLMVQVCNRHLTDKLAAQCPRELVEIVNLSDAGLDQGCWMVRYLFPSEAAQIAFMAVLFAAKVDAEVLPGYDPGFTPSQFFAVSKNPAVEAAVEAWVEEPSAKNFEMLVTMVRLAR